MLGRCLATPASCDSTRDVLSRRIIHVSPESLHVCMGQDLLHRFKGASCSISVQVWLLQDRLCYAVPGAADVIRYIPLDRITVRPLPRGYSPCIAVISNEKAPAPLRGRLERHFAFEGLFGRVFSVQYGLKTAYWAAATSQEAKACCTPSMSTSCCLQSFCDVVWIPRPSAEGQQARSMQRPAAILSLWGKLLDSCKHASYDVVEHPAWACALRTLWILCTCIQVR